MSGALSSRIAATALALSVDATTAEVLRAFRDAGCRSILLKGPALRRELYGDGSSRPYVDADLLVSPGQLPKAAAILTELGFALVMDHRDHPGITEPHAQEWERPPAGKTLDLHWRIPGIGASPERAWEILAPSTQPIAIGDTVGESLSRAGIALLVALHAAHHGMTRPRPLEDLERAVDQFGPDKWAEAARLAGELDASEAFAAGLRLAPAGESLAAALGLPTVRSPRRRLMAATQPPGSLGILRILDAATAGERVRALRSELFPGADFMRATSPLARRGCLGLLLAYVHRVAARTWQLPAAIRAVRWSRRNLP